jgi:tRNA pseudouridine38-40 synthase
LAYDGARYAGWQRQPNALAVQQVLEAALEQIAGAPVKTTGSSRTDAGVHALGQWASFYMDKQLPPRRLVRSLNAVLPEDVVVREASIVADGFDPIAAAKRKRYRYLIRDRGEPGLFDRQFAWHLHRLLDVTAMREAAQHLVGTHDFASFQGTKSQRQSTVRTVFEICVQRGDWGYFVARDRQAPCDAGKSAADHDQSIATANGEPAGALVAVEVAGNGFLYNMVRSIVGTLVAVGLHRRALRWPADVLASRDRKQAGQTAPAHGLFLVEIDGEEHAANSPRD